MAVSVGNGLVLSHTSQVLPPDSVIVGRSEVMRRLAAQANRAVKRCDVIWIDGEAGSGKDVLARWIHARSSFADGPFVKVHCPAIPPMLLSSELLGRRGDGFLSRGRRMGRVQAAQNGTLYLDQLAAIEPNLQERLLLILRHRHAGTSPEAAAVAKMRLIFSTQRSAFRTSEDELAPGSFQEFRPVHLVLPPLKERLTDIPILARYMVDAWGQRYGVPTKPLSKAIINLMEASSWRGNLRQLENVVRRYVVLGCDEEEISAELLEQTDLDRLTAFASAGALPLKQVVAERVRAQERNIILRALHEHDWNPQKTAQALGIGYQSLLQRMRRSEITTASDFTAAAAAAPSEFVN